MRDVQCTWITIPNWFTHVRLGTMRLFSSPHPLLLPRPTLIQINSPTMHIQICCLLLPRTVIVRLDAVARFAFALSGVFASRIRKYRSSQEQYVPYTKAFVWLYDYVFTIYFSTRESSRIILKRRAVTIYLAQWTYMALVFDSVVGYRLFLQSFP